MTEDEMWDRLIDLGLSEETLKIVTSINGYSKQTLCDVLYAHSGYRNFDQLESGDRD